MSTAPAERTGAANVTDVTVAKLLAAQCPEYSSHELGRVYHHHEHTAVRLGEHFGLVLPNFADQAERFAAAPSLLASAAPRWSFPVSIPVFLGEPTDDFPYPWHVVTWHEAATAANVPLNDAGGSALLAALAQVHSPAPTSAPTGVHSGIPLADHLDEWGSLLSSVAPRVGPGGERIEVEALDAAFRTCVAARIDTPRSWTHSNMSPLSVLSDRGAFAGICDWWNFAAGDPAADIGASTLLLSRAALGAMYRSYGRMSPALLARSRGYRMLYMLRFIATDNPFFTRYGWERLPDVALPERASDKRRR